MKYFYMIWVLTADITLGLVAYLLLILSCIFPICYLCPFHKKGKCSKTYHCEFEQCPMQQTKMLGFLVFTCILIILIVIWFTVIISMRK